MKDFLDAIRRQVTEFLARRTKKQKILMGAVTAAMVIVIIVSSVILGKSNYEVLYTGLNEAEAGKILTVLDEKNIDAKAQGSGTILVPSDVSDEVRMELAAEGYPESGLNYDIFSSASSFGKTDLEMKTYQQYQLQENLRNTIMMLDAIKDCVVIINMPSESLFVLSSDQQEASASVMLEIENGETLSLIEAKAITELVSKSVPNLKGENVRIMDTKMNLYDVTGENDEQYTGTQYELTEMVKDTLVQQVLTVLTPVFGADNVSAAVNVALNFDKETVNSVQFATPVEGDDNGLIVSMEELYEKTQGGGTAEGTAGTDSNGVGVSEYMFSDDTGDFSNISRSVNYELNETQTQIEKAQGGIENLSVAVLLNSDAYSDDYGESVKELVAKAIGVDEALVSVVSLPFQTTGDESGITGVFAEQAKIMEKLDSKEIIITAIIAITVLTSLFFIFRFIKYAFDYSPRRRAVTPDGYIEIPEDGLIDVSDRASDITELAKRTKSSDAEQIEKFVDKDPAAVAQLLRNWLTDEDR
ncbi:MAG: flagellar basal-body MS-ring/collar protein FliF [Oscillospiraceae bacterium]